jgi:hypothetical protein
MVFVYNAIANRLYRYRHVLLAFIIAAILCAGYGNIVGGYFISDDFERIAEARRGSLSYFGTAWDGTIGRPAYYRPLIVQTYALDYVLWGLKAAPYHLVNLLFHWLTSLLVALVTVELLVAAGAERRKAFWPGAAAGLAFAAAARHTEAVSWISGRADIAAAVFSLVAILCYLRFREAGGSKRYFVWLAVPFYVLALLCKESALAIPFIVLVFEVTFFGAADRYEKPGRYVGYGLVITLAGLLVAYLGVRYSVTGALLSGKKTYLFTDLGFWDYVKRAVKFTICVLAAPKRSLLLLSLRLPWDAVLYAYLFVATLVSGFLGFRRRNLKRPVTALSAVVVSYAAAAIPVFYMSSSLYTTDSERLAYFPGVFVLLFTVLLLYYLWRKGTAWILVGWALLNLPALIIVNNGWRYAGDLSSTLLDDYAELAGGPTLVLSLPDSVNDKYVFRRGFAEAVELTGAGPAPYGPALKTVYPAKEAGWVEWRRSPGYYIGSVERPGWFHPFDTNVRKDIKVVSKNENGYPKSVILSSKARYKSILYESRGRLSRLE